MSIAANTHSKWEINLEIDHRERQLKEQWKPPATIKNIIPQWKQLPIGDII